MKYLLDSDICIDVLTERRTWPIEEIRSTRHDSISLSVVTYGEVLEGVLFSRDVVHDMMQWRGFVGPLSIIDLTTDIANTWAELRGWLRRRGRAIADNDLMIASTALKFDMILVTRNVRHFARVPGLDILVPER